MKPFSGVVCIILALISLVYFNVYLLVKGIINIVYGEIVFWNVVMIILRNVVGFVFGLIFFITGSSLLEYGISNKWRK